MAQRSTRSFSGTGLVLPLFAVACSIISIVLLLSSGLGTRLNLWEFRTGFAILKVAAYSGLGCLLLSLASAIQAFKRRRLKGAAVSLAALVCALLAIGVPYSWKVKAERYPRIHDISTDVNNPPRFVALLPMRTGPANYPGSSVAALQLKAYPDIKTLVLPLPKDQAFQSALATARDLGWQVVAAVPGEGRIEATDTTMWFRFKDDIVIRIRPAGERSLVDLRSVSRVGISDVGTNARRIRTFVARISHAP